MHHLHTFILYCIQCTLITPADTLDVTMSDSDYSPYMDHVSMPSFKLKVIKGNRIS